MSSASCSKKYDKFVFAIHGCDKEDLEKFATIGGIKHTYGATGEYTFDTIDFNIGEITITLFGEELTKKP